jgi:hypothetical protein
MPTMPVNHTFFEGEQVEQEIYQDYYKKLGDFLAALL